MSLYQLTLYLHIIGAVMGIGPSAALWVFLAAVRRNPQLAPTLGPIMGHASKLPKVGGIVQLVTGLTMVGFRGWELLRLPWIWGSIVLLVAAAAIGGAVIEPAGKALAASALDGRVSAEKVNAATQRLGNALRLNTLIVLGILALMVYKP